MSKSHGALARLVRGLLRIGGGIAVQNDLLESTRMSKSIFIKYRNSRGQITERSVNVLKLGHGYIDAWDSRRNEMRTFKVNRIQWTELTETVFTVPDTYSSSGWVDTGLGEIKR